ncbi:MAG TPA: hypothetical protein PKA36_14630, partial [Pseudoxanthomonas mexicana]|nr:hypothetical protein [Pseudoxanthomonas mexicana]
ILLSASVEFEVFVQQVTACCRAGASGVAASLALRFVPEAEARVAFERLSLALAQRRLRW